MIVSMTGYGAAEQVENGATYALEVRSFNNRYFKATVKLPERLQFLEVEVEKLLRARISRGSVTYALRIKDRSESGAQALNVSALQEYVDQLTRVRVAPGVQTMIELASLVALPGVCEQPGDVDRDAVLRIITALTERVLASLMTMRREEGDALHRDLVQSCKEIRSELDSIRSKAPGVVTEYHQRLRDRVATLLKAGELALEAEALSREVAVFAERCDISEEITRLTSHLDQFAQMCDRGEQVGRTLDFLTQELLREANTIASKSNDAGITRSVVEIKGRIDRLREQVQNVE